MAESLNQEQYEDIGQIHISDEVIAIIAGTAALEIDGVRGASGHIAGEMVEKFGKRNFSKGVKVEVDGQEVRVELNLIVKSGYKIPFVSNEVQKRVKTALETMTGLSVAAVDVNVSAISMDKPKTVKEV